MDAAQPFDSDHHKSNVLKIAVIGFGNFGQFLAKTFVRQGHTVLAHSRSDYTKAAETLGVSFCADPNDLCEQNPEVVILCTSILSAEKVIKSFPVQRLGRKTLFVDVLSVKEFPRDLLLKHLPAEFDILCTHPMFGPESGKHSWAGLNFMYDKVRIGDDGFRVDRCDKFLDIFAKEGCEMVEMSCADHDRESAEIQFLTHTLGRVLQKLQLKQSQISTKGYETLLNLVENTCGDSFDLYNGLFLFNKNAAEQLERLAKAVEEVRHMLLEAAHGVVARREEEPAKLQNLLPVGTENGSDEGPPQNVAKNGYQNGAAQGVDDPREEESAKPQQLLPVGTENGSNEVSPQNVANGYQNGDQNGADEGHKNGTPLNF